ncbi:MAG: phage terminase small subunit P27 family [Chloroflexota bacterium]|nr:phage terminase small subunit P27 family [Chloroflexota bacterium]
MPRFLTGYARSLWRELAPQLKKRGLLTPLDRAAFVALCTTYERIRQCDEILGREGVILGNKKHPAFAIQARAIDDFRHLAREFGLTPASRAVLDLPEPSDNRLNGLLDDLLN